MRKALQQLRQYKKDSFSNIDKFSVPGLVTRMTT